jgi:hypothetical protein
MIGRKKSKTASRDDLYDTCVKAFENNDWKYVADKKDCIIYSEFTGDDMPIEIFLGVSDTILNYTCFLGFKAESSKYMEVAWSLNSINKDLTFGSFRLDPETGLLTFNYSHLYVESAPSSDLIAAIMNMVLEIVDKHDGDLKKIAVVTENSNPMFG